MQRRIMMVIAGVGVVAALWGAPPIYAQEKTPDILVSPAITEWIAGPQERQAKKVVVRNTTQQPLPVRAVVQNFAPREKIAPEDAAIFDASSWFSIKDPDFILKAGEYKEVSVTLHVPKSATPGGHYATVYFQQLGPVIPKKQQATNVVGRVGSLAFVTVKGDIQKKVERTAPLSIKREHGGYAFETTLKNMGNTHVLPTITYTIHDWQGKQIALIKAQPGILLPKTERSYTARWHQAPLAGRFTVTPQLTYGELNRQVALPTKQIWQIPIKGITLLIVAPLMVWLFGYRVRSRWRRAWSALWKSR